MPDYRPICDCGSYNFPHKLGGGRCTGDTYAEYYFLHDRSECEYCQCNNDTYCDIVTGQESIRHAACYTDALHSNPGGHVTLEYVPEEHES